MDRFSLEEEACRFSSFANEDALALGLLILRLAKARSPKGIALSIDYDDGPIFLHFMEGTDARNVYWVNAKRNVVKRFGKSSLALNAEYEAMGKDFNEATGLPKDGYRAEGGSIPLVVERKGRVGTITISGLTSEEDHALAVEGVKRYLAGERA
jgi:uncharacterized protein (UPF0303 family)